MDILLFLKILFATIALYYIIRFNTLAITGEMRPMIWMGKVLWLCFLLLTNILIPVWCHNDWWWANVPLLIVVIYTPALHAQYEQEQPGDWFAHRMVLLGMLAIAWLITGANVAAT